MLECDFVLRKAVDLLKAVQEGERSFGRSVQVAVSDRLEEHHIRGRLPHNLKTLDALLADLYYVRNHSLRLDWHVLAQTARLLLARKGLAEHRRYQL